MTTPPSSPGHHDLPCLRIAAQLTGAPHLTQTPHSAGHAGARGLDGESHFDLVIQSEAFAGVRGLKRHQMVYAALGDDMKAIHALSIKALAPGEEAP